MGNGRRARRLGALAIALLVAAAWRAGAQAAAADAPSRVLFPSDHLAAPLIANPREPGFQTSLVRGSSPGPELDALIGIAEQGGTFGIARWNRSSGLTTVQLDVTGSVAAQFDLSTVHWDLLNVDFTFGFPVTVRRGETVARVRVYHLSSHLGDEFIRRDSIWVWGDPPPVPPGFRTYHQSYRFEAIELVLMREWRGWRAYGGLDYFWYLAPALLDRRMALGGLEVSQPIGARRSFVAALDVTMMEYRDWAREWSFRTGFEVGRAGDRGRRGRRAAIMFLYHDGPAPYGQFVTRTSLRYVGGGVFLTL